MILLQAKIMRRIKAQLFTRKVAMATPMMKPAITSDQWLRYSATLLIPVRKARHISPRDITGLANLVPLAFTEQVMYIWKERIEGLPPCLHSLKSSFQLDF